MSLSFYMDVHVPWAITTELRLRGVNVVTAQEDGAGQFKDPMLLDRASALGRVLVTFLPISCAKPCGVTNSRYRSRESYSSLNLTLPSDGQLSILNSVQRPAPLRSG